MLDGQTIRGGCVSLTVTVKAQLAAGGTPLSAVQVTVVTPTGKTCGEVMTALPSVHVTVGAGLPVAVTAKATDAPHTPGVLPVEMSAGQPIVGGVPTTPAAVRTSPSTACPASRRQGPCAGLGGATTPGLVTPKGA